MGNAGAIFLCRPDSSQGRRLVDAARRSRSAAYVPAARAAHLPWPAIVRLEKSKRRHTRRTPPGLGLSATADSCRLPAFGRTPMEDRRVAWRSSFSTAWRKHLADGEEPAMIDLVSSSQFRRVKCFGAAGLGLGAASD